jgi:hypothetical protein
MTPIIDAHHHIWRRRDLPWLDGPIQPSIFGPSEPIRRDYPISEYLEDIAGCDVTRSVYVQANWAKDAFEDEVAYVQRAADEAGYPQAIVGYADFLLKDVRPQLDRLTKYRGMRGLRMHLHWHENPQYRFAADPDLARNPTLQRNVANLVDYNWSFDLQVFAGQRDGAGTSLPAVPRLFSSFSTPACWKTFPRPNGRNGAPGCAVSPRARTWFRSCPASARSSIATIPTTSRPSCAKLSRRSVRHAVCSARTSRSKNCGRGIPASSRRIEARSRRSEKRRRARRSMKRRRQGFIGSID